MKCKINSDRSLEACGGMEEAYNRRMNRNQGLRLVQYANLDSGNHTRQGVVLKNGAKDRGLMLNFCPFCGENIATHELEAV